jgi:hypothetical protein
MSEHEEDPFLTRSREILDERTEHLDAATRSRLRQARSRALEGTGDNRSWLYWVPAGSLAAVLLLFAVYVNRLVPPLPVIYQDPVQLETAESMELLDDLDFVAWLVVEESG